jgi:hypothetical protein
LGHTSHVFWSIWKNDSVKAKLLLHRFNIWHPFLGRCTIVKNEQWTNVIQDMIFNPSIAKAIVMQRLHDPACIEIIIEYCTVMGNNNLLGWIIENDCIPSETKLINLSRAMIQASMLGHQHMVK